jgi:hypothetical protein
MAGNFISAGGLIKKLLAINPRLSSYELISIFRQSTHAAVKSGEHDAKDAVDEAKAISLAESTVLKLS